MLVKKGFDPYGRIEIRSPMAEMRGGGGGKFNIFNKLCHFMSIVYQALLGCRHPKRPERNWVKAINALKRPLKASTPKRLV